VPIEVAVPAIGVNAATPALGLNDDGTLEVPSVYGEAGWYAYGPRPGEPGPAVMAGHVDSRTGPAVFFRLDEVQPGHLVHVLYDTGHVATFEVHGAETVPKDAFPTARVYGDTPQSELRLITCSGAFDRASGHYGDNLIVYATLLASWHYEA
jgi:sortase (surface protein transpeptidase)